MGHIITFWGRGFIGGDYHYLGARLLATSIQSMQSRKMGNLLGLFRRKARLKRDPLNALEEC